MKSLPRVWYEFALTAAALVGSIATGIFVVSSHFAAPVIAESLDATPRPVAVGKPYEGVSPEAITPEQAKLRVLADRVDWHSDVLAQLDRDNRMAKALAFPSGDAVLASLVALGVLASGLYIGSQFAGAWKQTQPVRGCPTGSSFLVEWQNEASSNGWEKCLLSSNTGDRVENPARALDDALAIEKAFTLTRARSGPVPNTRIVILRNPRAQ